MRRPGVLASIGLLLLLIYQCNCLYEDQVGKFDWSIKLIGKPKFVHYVHNGQAVKRIVVGTEQNVLAVLNGKDGALGWRHVFEKSSLGRIDDVKVSGQSVLVVLSGGTRVRCFNVVNGALRWESSIHTTDINHPASLQVYGRNAGLVAVSTLSNLTALNIETGSTKWTVQVPNSLSSTHTYTAQIEGTVIVIKIEPSSHINIIGFDQERAITFSREISASWITANKELCTTSSGRHFVCLDVQNKKVYSMALLTDSQFHSFSLEKSAADIVKPSFQNLETVGNSGVDVVALKLKEDNLLVFSCQHGDVELKHDLNGVTAVQTVIHSGEIILGALTRISSEMLKFSAHSLSSKNLPSGELEHSFKFAAHHGRPFQFYGASLKSDNSGKMKSSLLIISEDDSIVYIQQSGKFMWTREESLSNILTTEMVDLPVSKIMAKMENEFGVEGSPQTVLQMFVRRFTTQFSQLKTFILQVMQNFQTTQHQHHHRHHQAKNQASEEDEDIEGVTNGDGDVLDENYLTRDEFNLHKMIIAVTATGKIFGIDSNTGKNVWKIFVPDLEPFVVMSNQLVLPLHVQRTTSHFPQQPQCTLLGRSKSTGNTLMFSFHPISGAADKSTGEVLKFKVINSMMLQQFDEHFLHPILLLDENYEIHVVPETAGETVKKLLPSFFMFNVDAERGSVTGLNIKLSESDKAVPLWSLDLGKNSQVVTGVYSKPANEHVHSIGLALEDRSVLYKYLNPNLVVVVTEGEDVSQKDSHIKGMFNVYLIDSVSGNIVYHCNHKRSRGPVHVIHSENWVVYNYWNQKYRRNELAVLELFEGTTQSNETSFSSLHPPPPPIVMKQAYIFPSHLATMGVTLTEKGLTSKELLFALESGSILGLPKIFIDPRRPEVVSHESREEGLIPYMPELPRPPERIINYHQIIHNIRHIRTSPAGLESTSLVFCFGLDLFFTRVTPSKMFDVLKEDFDYFFISSVLIGMIVVSLASQKLASRKMLNRAWK